MPPVDIGDRLRALPLGKRGRAQARPARVRRPLFRGAERHIARRRDRKRASYVYITVTNPASFVWGLAQALDVTPDRISFVDAISHLMMDYSNPLPNATYIESPRALEEIMLRVGVPAAEATRTRGRSS